MSEILEMASEMARELDRIGVAKGQSRVLSGNREMIAADEFNAERVVAIRAAAQLSRTVFAAALNVHPTTVAAWENGDNKPSGAAVRLLRIVEQGQIEVLFDAGNS